MIRSESLYRAGIQGLSRNPGIPALGNAKPAGHDLSKKEEERWTSKDRKETAGERLEIWLTVLKQQLHQFCVLASIH